MKLLCITDPHTHPSFDTTQILYNRFAKHPEIEFFHLPASGVNDTGQLLVAPVCEQQSFEEFLALDPSATHKADIRDFDLIFSRTDKPYPDNYLENLSLFENEVLFVNRPSSILEVISKEFIGRIAKSYQPAHTYSRDVQELTEFFETHQKIVAKMSVSYGGRDVYKIWREDGAVKTDNIERGENAFPDFPTLLSYLFDQSPEWEFVRYLSRIAEGDKRVFVVGGEIVGGFLRKSPSGHWVHNITTGGKHHLAEIGEHEREVVAATVGEYSKRGVNTLGYDFLMDDDGTWLLSEVNAGNIGGYNWPDELGDKPIIDPLVEWLIAYARS